MNLRRDRRAGDVGYRIHVHRRPDVAPVLAAGKPARDRALAALNEQYPDELVVAVETSTPAPPITP